MTFQNVTTLTAVLTGLLSLTLVFVPGLIYWLFAWQGNELGDLLARRAGMLFLGFAVLCFLGRAAQTGEAQRLVAAAVGVAMAALAVLGLFEFARGTVGPGIFLAVGVEVFLAGFYARFWLPGGIA